MLNEADIWRTANIMVTERGDDAALAAVTHALKLLDDGDPHGALAWERILDAINWLQAASAGDRRIH